LFVAVDLVDAVLVDEDEFVGVDVDTVLRVLVLDALAVADELVVPLELRKKLGLGHD